MVNDLIPIFGEAFLRYVLVIENGSLSSCKLSDHQREIAEALRQHVFSLGPGEAQFDQYSRAASLGVVLHPPVAVEPNKEELLALSSYWITGLGGMVHHELLPLIGLLVTNARLWALVEQGADTWGSLLDALPNVVAAVRDLASGKTIEVPYLAGFRGASLSAGVEVSLSSGLLCAPRPVDCSFLLPNADCR